MSNGSFVVNSRKGQSLKVGSFIALDQCNKFNLIMECSNTKLLLHVSVSHPFKSGNPEISPGGVQNEKIENP